MTEKMGWKHGPDSNLNLSHEHGLNVCERAILSHIYIKKKIMLNSMSRRSVWKDTYPGFRKPPRH